MLSGRIQNTSEIDQTTAIKLKHFDSRSAGWC